MKKVVRDLMDHRLSYDELEMLHAAGQTRPEDLLVLHRMGPYAVAEFHCGEYSADLPVFYAFYRGRDTEMLFEGLESAMIYLVCHGRSCGPGTPAQSLETAGVQHEMICRALQIVPTLRPLDERMSPKQIR